MLVIPDSKFGHRGSENRILGHPLLIPITSSQAPANFLRIWKRFGGGRRMRPQAYRMCHFRDQGCGSGHGSRIALGLDRGRHGDPEY